MGGEGPGTVHAPIFTVIYAVIYTNKPHGACVKLKMLQVWLAVSVIKSEEYLSNISRLWVASDYTKYKNNFLCGHKSMNNTVLSTKL